MLLTDRSVYVTVLGYDQQQERGRRGGRRRHSRCLDGGPTRRTRRRPRRAARGTHARRRRQQSRLGHGPRAGRHRDGHQAGSSQPGLLRRQRRALPTGLWLRRAGLSDAVLHRSRSRPGPRPDRAAAPTGPRRRVAVRFRHRRPRHRTGSGRDAGRVVCAGRRVHQRTAQRAGLHRGVDRPSGRRPGTLCVHRAAGDRRPRRRRRHRGRSDRHRARGAHRRPRPRRGRRACRRTHPGRRYPSPGGRHRTAAPCESSRICRWSSTSPTGSIGGQESSVACCGG